MTNPARVASPPAKPLMIYDGDCNFCKFWIIRWQQATQGRVEYIASQEARVAAQFPEMPRENFQQAVQFIETGGRVFSGAEAVFRALSYGRYWSWTLWAYENVPGTRPGTETAYAFVAKRREGFSFLTRLLWGRDGAWPSYSLTGWIFLRLLGIVYLSAFVSLGTQIGGLLGGNGILPVKQFMGAARTQLDQNHIGWARYHLLPTLCWFNASDGFLHFLCAAGDVLALLVVANVAPAACLFLLWIIYLSLVSVGGDFLSFQWDALLLETGFLAIFFAPKCLWPRLVTAGVPPAVEGGILPPGPTHELSGVEAMTGFDPPGGTPGSTTGGTSAAAVRSPPIVAGPSRMMLWLLRWLLFRLMFESGTVKLLSKDVTWRNLTALNFHYETQPLPTWIGWYAHQLPGGVQTACVFAMFVIELAVPFLIFAPRRLRFLGCGLLLLLQLCILLTGNYCFFNLLTIALCVLLLDDAWLKKLVPTMRRAQPATRNSRDVSPSPCEERAGRGAVLNQSIDHTITPLPDTLPIRSSSGEGIRLPHWLVRVSKRALMSSLEEITVPNEPVILNPNRRGAWPPWVLALIGVPIILITLTQVFAMLGLGREWSGPAAALDGLEMPFRSVNTYGLFAVMTTSRREIEIQGSNDGTNWLAYEFKYKPGDLKRRPRFVAPHQPRLDWQMWFAALGTYRQNPWFVNFCVRLLQGSPEVLPLLARDPFPNAPPKYLRAMVYDYHFSNWRERRTQGVWWRREPAGEYLPVISLDNRDNKA